MDLPLLTFPVYGLDADWVGPRWLEMIESGGGPGVYGLVLMHGSGHQPRPGETWVSVTSSPAFGTSPDQPIDRPQRAAESAMLRLVDMTTPKLRTREQSRSQRTLLGFAFHEAARHQDWIEHTWQIDGAPIMARTFAWAGAWAGFAIVNDVAVVIHAVDFRTPSATPRRGGKTPVTITSTFRSHRPCTNPEPSPETGARGGTGGKAGREPPPQPAHRTPNPPPPQHTPGEGRRRGGEGAGARGRPAPALWGARRRGAGAGGRRRPPARGPGGR